MNGYTDSRRDYGYKTHKRDGFRCQYCGFDGTSFDGWQQLSVDRILPGNQGGKYEPDNTITACNACNSITSRMTFEPGQSREEIIERKKRHVAERRAAVVVLNSLAHYRSGGQP